jgi:hypothetical protein
MQISYFNYRGYTILFQIISAFTLGIIFAPWSKGLIFLIIFILCYEAIYFNYYVNICNLPYNRYFFLVRFGVFCATLLGWLIGRSLMGDLNPLRSKYSTKRTLPIHKKKYNKNTNKNKDKNTNTNKNTNDKEEEKEEKEDEIID